MSHSGIHHDQSHHLGVHQSCIVFMPSLQTRRTVESALDVDLATAFISFDKTPLASASVAQVTQVLPR